MVTNQQGIGKKLYRIEDLEIIHKNMLYEIAYHGGKIDKVYFSPQGTVKVSVGKPKFKL